MEKGLVLEINRMRNIMGLNELSEAIVKPLTEGLLLERDYSKSIKNIYDDVATLFGKEGDDLINKLTKQSFKSADDIKIKFDGQDVFDNVRKKIDDLLVPSHPNPKVGPGAGHAEKILENKTTLLDMLDKGEISENAGKAWENMVDQLPDDIKKVKLMGKHGGKELGDYLMSYKADVVSTYKELETAVFDVLDKPKGSVEETMSALDNILGDDMKFLVNPQGENVLIKTSTSVFSDTSSGIKINMEDPEVKKLRDDSMTFKQIKTGADFMAWMTKIFKQIGAYVSKQIRLYLEELRILYKGKVKEYLDAYIVKKTAKFPKASEELRAAWVVNGTRWAYIKSTIWTLKEIMLTGIKFILDISSGFIDKWLFKPILKGIKNKELKYFGDSDFWKGASKFLALGTTQIVRVVIKGFLVWKTTWVVGFWQLIKGLLGGGAENTIFQIWNFLNKNLLSYCESGLWTWLFGVGAPSEEKMSQYRLNLKAWEDGSKIDAKGKAIPKPEPPKNDCETVLAQHTYLAGIQGEIKEAFAAFHTQRDAMVAYVKCLQKLSDKNGTGTKIPTNSSAPSKNTLGETAMSIYDKIILIKPGDDPKTALQTFTEYESLIDDLNDDKKLALEGARTLKEMQALCDEWSLTTEQLKERSKAVLSELEG